MSVFVGGLAEDTQKEDLEREFSRFGNLTKVWVARNPPGFAFIDFENDDEANEAIKEMNGATFNGSEIRVDVSRSNGRRPRGGSGGFRGSREGGFRGSRDGGGFSRGRRGGFDSGSSSGFRRGGGGFRGSRGGGSRFGGGGDYGSGYRSRSPMDQRSESNW
ncbi:hypothetical protein AVEN_192252-1 [Araneus ventricosus]|nr:hypothetical protein AVEN_192252-1 [Araneus ventricosus]